MGKSVKVLFIHHSTGGLLIRYGKVRKLLKQKAPDIEFWDHSYNAAHTVCFHSGSIL